MPQNVQTVHVDAILTNLSIMYRNMAYVAEQVLPVVPVKKESDKYFVYGREAFKRVESIRASGAKANRITYGLSTATYTAEEYALADSVPDRVRDNADDPLDPELDAVEQLTERIWLGYEARVAAAVLDTTNTFTGTNDTEAADATWATATTYIQKDVFDAISKIRLKCGRVPNTIVIPYIRALEVARNSDIRDMVKYTNPNLLAKMLLPQSLWGLNVVIPGSVENTAAEGLAETMADVWTNTKALVAYVEPKPTIRSFTLGATFRAREWRVRKWRDEEAEATVVEVSVLQAEKVIASQGGCVITSIA